MISGFFFCLAARGAWVQVGMRIAWLLIMTAGYSQIVAAEIEVVAGSDLQCFGGGERTVPVSFRNPTSHPVAPSLRYRLFQSTSGLLAPIGPPQEWKAVTIGPGQTVTDTLSLNLPSVRGPALFSVVWSAGETKLGSVRLRVFQPGLLQALAALAGDGKIGLVDPAGRLAPALGEVRLELLVEAEPVAAFEGKLLLVAPLTATNRIAGLSAALKRRAAAGTGVVWLRPSGEGDPALAGSLHVLELEQGRVVVADASLVEDLSQSPMAQLRLVMLAELALGRKKLALPEETGDTRLSQHE
jgi:hypothetical protein